MDGVELELVCLCGFENFERVVVQRKPNPPVVTDFVACGEWPNLGALLGGSVSSRDRRVGLTRREPALEVADVLAIENGAPDLQQRASPLASPAHVSVSFHALADHVVDHRLCAGRRDRESERPSTSVVDELGRAAPQVANEASQRVVSSDHPVSRRSASSSSKQSDFRPFQSSHFAATTSRCKRSFVYASAP
jgi:hypothetical protein